MGSRYQQRLRGPVCCFSVQSGALCESPCDGAAGAERFHVCVYWEHTLHSVRPRQREERWQKQGPCITADEDTPALYSDPRSLLRSFPPSFDLRACINPVLLCVSARLSPHNFVTICHRSSGCLATGSCLSQQVATMTSARQESGNKDIRCCFPLLVCGHFPKPPVAAVCVFTSASVGSEGSADTVCP